MTLELALSGVPTVAAYRLHALEEIIARLIRLASEVAERDPWPIWCIGENVVPELLQEDCTPEKLAARA